MASQNSYLCDTLPQAKLAQAAASHPSHDPVHTSLAFQSEKQLTVDNLEMDPPEDVHRTLAPPPRKLCPRHKRMADEGTNLKLQQVRDRQITNMFAMLIYIPPGFGCSPSAGARGRQRHLGQLFSLTSSPACLDSSRSVDHVLFLSALFTRRPTLPHHSDRPLLRSPP